MAFYEELRQRGYVEGQNLIVERRNANRQPDQLPALAKELVALQPDLIVASGPQPSRATKDATSTIPIVMIAVADPVRAGLAASLARLGGNLTGVTTVVAGGIMAKSLDYLHQVAPKATRIGMLVNPTNDILRILIPLEIPDAARQLGVQIIRTTRALRLTPEGMAFHARALRILAEVEEAESLLQARTDEPGGRLRISAPLLFGQAFMGGIAAAYRARCPKVAIEVVLVDRRVDLIEEGFDAAIRVGELPDSNLVFRKFAEVDQVVVATPKWVCDKPVNGPLELAERPCLAHSVDAATRSTWRLMNGTEAISVTVTPVITMSSLVALRDAALAGAGFAFLPRFMVAKDIEDGRLAHANASWVGVKSPISIVYPSSRLLSARLRAFIDLLVERFPEGVL